MASAAAASSAEHAPAIDHFDATVPKEFTTYLLSYRNIPLSEWQKHPRNSRANETSALNPIAKPQNVVMEFVTTSSSHANYFERRDNGLTAATGRFLVKQAKTTKKAQHYLTGAEKVQLAREKEFALERKFEAEARQAFGLGAAQSGANGTLGKSKSSAVGAGESSEVPLKWVSSFAQRALAAEQARSRADPVAEERLQRYFRSVYPPDFTPSYTAMQYNLSEPQPYRAPAVSESGHRLRIPGFEPPLRSEASFKFNFIPKGAPKIPTNLVPRRHF